MKVDRLFPTETAATACPIFKHETFNYTKTDIFTIEATCNGAHVTITLTGRELDNLEHAVRYKF